MGNTNRKKYVKQEYLPTELVLRLTESIWNNSNYQYPTKDNFLQCVSIIYYHQVHMGYGIYNYVPLGRNYWHKIFGGNYYEKVLKPLLNEHRIIERYDFGYRTYPDNHKNNFKGKQDGIVGIRYRINPELLNDSFESIPYIGDRVVSTALERLELCDKEFLTTGIPDLNFRVSIDQHKASNWVESNADLICDKFLKSDYINSLPDTLSIETKELIENSGNWSFRTKYRTAKAAKLVAKTQNKELFYFKDTFYIADVREFLKQRIARLSYHYKQQISQIQDLPIEEKRSPVTLRLYSHLTSFPSKILQFININNRTVVQLDLRTSQFLIFANLLNVYLSHGEQGLLSRFKQDNNQTYLKKLVKILKRHQSQLPDVGVSIKDSTSGNYGLSDVTMFIRDVFFNDFYGVVQKELGLQERLLAKQVLFKLLFKKTNRPDELLKKLMSRYPVVMSIITEFKKLDATPETKRKPKDGYNDLASNFSVFLQCVEAEIFVDNILNKLRDEGIPCFTRHDSIVVARGIEERSEEIAEQVFKEFGFKYNHRVEDKFWEVVDYDELDSSGYLQSVIDENELTQDFYEEELESNEDEPNVSFDLDEQDLETLERLREIGIREEYYEYIDVEFLEDLTLLPFLNETQRNILYDDINNLNYDMSFLQPNTNKLLGQLLRDYDRISGFPV